MRITAIVVAAAAGLTVPNAAHAQAAAANPGAGPPVSFELRVGALWPHAPLVVDENDVNLSRTRASAGGRLSWYFGKGRFDRRLSAQISADWAELGAAEFVDDLVGSGARTEGHAFVVTPALGLDLLRTRRMTLDARVGPAILVDVTTYLLERFDPDFDESEFDNVCDLVVFNDRCSDRTRFGGALGFGARWIVKPSWQLFAGFDYTRLTTGGNVLVATVGRDMR